MPNNDFLLDVSKKGGSERLSTVGPEEKKNNGDDDFEDDGLDDFFDFVMIEKDEIENKLK